MHHNCCWLFMAGIGVDATSCDALCCDLPGWEGLLRRCSCSPCGQGQQPRVESKLPPWGHSGDSDATLCPPTGTSRTETIKEKGQTDFCKNSLYTVWHWLFIQDYVFGLLPWHMCRCSLGGLNVHASCPHISSDNIFFMFNCGFPSLKKAIYLPINSMAPPIHVETEN